MLKRNRDGKTTPCGKTASRIAVSKDMSMVTCPRCIDKLGEGVISIQEGHATLNPNRKCPKCGKPTILCDGGFETCSSNKCNYVSRGN